MKIVRAIVLSVLIAFLSVAGMFAQTPTTNHIVADDVTLMPGDEETQYMALTLLSSVKYAAYNVDVVLPEGVEPAYDEGDLDVYIDQNTIVPYKKGTPSHTLSVTYFEDDRTLRISCVSTSSAEFKQASGVLCYIGLVAGSYTKPETLSTKLEGQNLTNKDAEKFVPADATYENITIGTTGYATLSVSSTNKWSTCILPFATALPEGLKAYTISSKDDDEQVFYLTEATAIDAFTPYVLYSESGYTGTLTGEVGEYPASGTVTQGYLTGALEKQTTNEGYILQNKGAGVKFYIMDDSKSYTIPAGKCWATLPTSGAQSYSFDFAPTAVKNLSEEKSMKEGTCYSIVGTRQDSPSAGSLYIQNGKKYIK